MAIELRTPGAGELAGVVDALRDWQSDDAPSQLHPGDLGWFWRFGSEATAAAVRIWSRDGHVLAVGLLDGRSLLRLTTAPDARRDEELAQRLFEDVTTPARGVLGRGRVAVESPAGSLVKEPLAEAGWLADEPWAPLRRDLAGPVEDPALRIEVAGPELAGVRTALQRAAFDRSVFDAEAWLAMAAGPAYADARCLVGYDDAGVAVAATTVWSAGPGRPGLIEPLGVHRDHRGRGHGRAITLAAASALRELGSSSVVVATPASNAGGVAAYRSAGLEARPGIHDQYRAG